MTTIAIEDFCEDIVGKAMRGLRLSDQTLAPAAGVEAKAIEAVLEGKGDESTLRAIAPHFGLATDKLAASFHQRWHPQDHLVDGLFMSNTEYHDMRVNAYLAWDPVTKQGAMLDTGADASELLDHAKKHGITISHIFLTHTHNDHIQDLSRVRRAFPNANLHVGSREPLPEAQPVKPDDQFTINALTITARLTWGHSKGGITYVIDGLAKPIAVVGDAIFAGSMGGGMVSYNDALKTNREQILTLPKETILCPGHGPLTSVEEELVHNPFF